MKLLTFLEKAVITLLGIICLSSLPAIFIFDQQLKISFTSYLLQIGETIKTLFLHPTGLSFYYKGVEKPLLSSMMEPYLYSMKILLAALTLSVVLSMIVSSSLLMMPKRLASFVRKGTSILNSAPDVLIIIGLQLLVIFIYKQTNILLFNIVSLYDNPTYVLPIICLAIPPTIQLTKIIILYLEDESSKDYVILARSKGIGFNKVLIAHIYRNVLLNLVPHFRSHFVFILSNLIILEYIFNINGLTKFLLDYGTSNTGVLTIGLLLLFLPIQFILLIVDGIITKRFGIKGEYS
ncbi:ABC transporter permease subunit [Bacillus sp. DJP31]|uniref:ABC transporter permease subunit n=1 Tax=Bacillus sp. DJP31 TaxID=3409789 RepID=UPI003BB618B6